MNDMRPVLAVFDFDGTMTDRHTFIRYMAFLVGRPKLFAAIAIGYKQGIGALTGRVPVMDARAHMLARILRGVLTTKERERAAQFARHCEAWILPEAKRRIDWHRECGHTLVLLSNSSESYLSAVGRALGFTHVIGTRLESEGLRLTGRVDGRDCVSEEKVRRLEQVVGRLTDYCVYAYGDSTGDLPLLAVADFPHFNLFQRAPGATSQEALS
jgi:phosphatidylglycerophosphatase C